MQLYNAMIKIANKEMSKEALANLFRMLIKRGAEN